VLDDTRSDIELIGRHSLLRVPFGLPAPGRPEAIAPALAHLMAEAGLDAKRFAGPASSVRAEMQRVLRRRDDYDFSRLSDDQLTDNHQYYVFPNTTLNVYGLRLMLLRHRPHPSDPDRMFLDQQQYVRVPRGRARPSRPPHQLGPSLGFVTDQDIANLARVQRGMHASGFTGLILGDKEERLRHMHRVLDEYLA
jgi:hypothetical protein